MIADTHNQSSMSHPELPVPVKVFFPLHQVAMLTAALLLLALQPVNVLTSQWLYVGLVSGWAVRVGYRLMRQSWRTVRLCSTSTTMAIASSFWHALLGQYLHVPWASYAALATLFILGLYGVLCRDH